MKRLLKKSPFFVLGLYGAEKGRSCNRLASLVASQPVSPIAVPDEAPVKADKRATTWGERENKLVKPQVEGELGRAPRDPKGRHCMV